MFKLEIQTDNAAFEDNGIANELSDILHTVAMMVKGGNAKGSVSDSNGNTVGRFELSQPTADVMDTIDPSWSDW
jgi:hypothetical protein